MLERSKWNFFTPVNSVECRPLVYNLTTLKSISFVESNTCFKSIYRIAVCISDKSNWPIKDAIVTHMYILHESQLHFATTQRIKHNFKGASKDIIVKNDIYLNLLRCQK